MHVDEKQTREPSEATPNAGTQNSGVPAEIGPEHPDADRSAVPLQPTIVMPVPSIREIARAAAENLASAIESDPRDRITIRIERHDDTTEPVVVPAATLRNLIDALRCVARGRAARIEADRAELSSFAAADLLGVSRTRLIALLDRQAIPYRRVGRHRRILRDHVLAYRKTLRKEEKRRERNRSNRKFLGPMPPLARMFEMLRGR